MQDYLLRHQYGKIDKGGTHPKPQPCLVHIIIRIPAKGRPASCPKSGISAEEPE